MDKFCSDEKQTSSENGQVLSDWAGLGGRRWAAAGLEKRIREEAGPKSRKRISELKIGFFLNLPRLGNLHKKI
jgi:hypothetical protein